MVSKRRYGEPAPRRSSLAPVKLESLSQSQSAVESGPSPRSPAPRSAPITSAVLTMPRNMNCANRRVLRGTSRASGTTSASSDQREQPLGGRSRSSSSAQQGGVDTGHDDHVGDAGEEADQAGERRVRAVPPAGLGPSSAIAGSPAPGSSGRPVRSSDGSAVVRGRVVGRAPRSRSWRQHVTRLARASHWTTSGMASRAHASRSGGSPRRARTQQGPGRAVADQHDVDRRWAGRGSPRPPARRGCRVVRERLPPVVRRDVGLRERAADDGLEVVDPVRAVPFVLAQVGARPRSAPRSAAARSGAPWARARSTRRRAAGRRRRRARTSSSYAGSSGHSCAGRDRSISGRPWRTR